MGKKKNKKNKEAAVNESGSAVAAEGAEKSQQDALREAVEAARESAVVLREAASVLSASASVPRWNSYPPLIGPAGMPAGAPDPMRDNRPPLYTEGVLVESAQGAPSLTIKASTLETDTSSKRAQRPSAAKQAMADSLRDSGGYKPKEPSSSNSRSGRGKTSGSGSGSILSNLPKFGKAPDPLPEPSEILASVPSLATLGMISPKTSVTQSSGNASSANNKNTTAGASSSSLSDQIKPLNRSKGSSTSSNASQVSTQSRSSSQPSDSSQFAAPQSSAGSAAETVQLHIGEELPMEYDPRNGMPIQGGMYDQPLDYGQQYMYDPQNPYGQTPYDGYYQQPYDPQNPYGYDMGYMGYDEMPPYDMAPAKSGKATVSLILGILSILLALIPPIGIILAVAALLLSKSYIKAGGMAPRASTGRVCGFAGLILSIILLIAYAIFIAYFVGGLYGSVNAGAIMGYLQTTFLAQFL